MCNDTTIRCPKCSSTELHIDKQGFKTGRAVAGGLLTGNILISLVAGGVGMNKIQITCLKCGHRFKASEVYSTTSVVHDRNVAEFEKHVVKEREQTAIYHCDCGKESCLPINSPICPRCGRRLPASKQVIPKLQEKNGCLSVLSVLLISFLIMLMLYF